MDISNLFIPNEEFDFAWNCKDFFIIDMNNLILKICLLKFNYGAQYEGGDLDAQDVPCAVCRSPIYNTVD